MTRLKLPLILVGLVLVVTAVVLDVSLGREAWGRIVGWFAIVALAGAVAIRVHQRRMAVREGQRDDSPSSSGSD